MKIEEITDTADFHRLAPIWNRLLARSNADTVFLTWEWVSNWWKVYGSGKDLWVLTLRDDTGALIGIAPLYRRRRKILKSITVNEIRFLGSGEDVSPDYLDFIIERGKESEAIEAVAAYLASRVEWDVLDLTDVLSTSLTAMSFKSIFARDGFSVHDRTCATCPYIVLPSSWDEFLNTLSANARYNVKRRIKNIERDFRARFFVWEDMEGLDGAMESLARLHNKRWEEREVRHSFSSDEYISFHKAVARDFAKQGWLHLSCLELNGELIGMLYDYHYGDKLFYYQAGFDPAFHKYSPGLVLRAYVIQKAIHDGVRELDFLKGAYAHKYLWTPYDRSTLSITVGRQSKVGRLYFFSAFRRKELKDAVKRVFPVSLTRPAKR